MTAHEILVRNMVGVVLGTAVVTAVVLALGRGKGPVTVYEPSTYERPSHAKPNPPYAKLSWWVLGPPTAESGKAVFEAAGCNVCHTTDGSSRVGPSFKGRWGMEVTLVDGTTIKFDESYLRESIANPQAKAQPGFPPSMPGNYSDILREPEIASLIEYFKTL